MILPSFRDFTTSRFPDRTGIVRGDVKIAGDPETPGRWRVTLYREGSVIPGHRRATLLECLAAQWSAPADGAYEFRFVPQGYRYTVVAHDHNGVYDPVTKAGLIPE
jgi:hypothetical protein